MAAAPSAHLPTQIPTPAVSVDAGLTPPEIIRFRRGTAGTDGDYYQALGAAAQVRLRLLGTLHARSELDGDGREAARRRLAAQQTQAWKQLEWLVTEMRRLDELNEGASV
jgi:hypothetical protein